MKKYLLLIPFLFLTIVFTSCSGGKATPVIANPTQPMSQMSDQELQQMADRYQQLMEMDGTGQWQFATLYGVQSSVYQNEILRRQNQRLVNALNVLYGVKP